MDYTEYDTLYGLPPRVVVSIYIGIAVLGLFGVVGNALSIVVWTRPHMKSSSAIMLTVLAVCDIMIVSFTSFHSVFTAFVRYDLIFFNHNQLISFVSRYVLPFVDVWASPVASIFKTATIYLTLAITVERYIAVCYPFQYQDIYSYSRACKSTAIIVIISILFNIINFWALEVKASTERDGTVWTYYYMPSEVYYHPLMVFYRNWIRLFFMYIIPLSALIVCNTAVCIKLTMARRERRGLTDFNKKELRLTMMLVYVVIEFIVCHSVLGFAATANSFKIDMDFNPDPLIPVGDFFEVFNSSINFVTYVTFGKPFRKTFLDTFGCLGCCTDGCLQRRRSVSKNRGRNLGGAMPNSGIRMMKRSDDNP